MILKQKDFKISSWAGGSTTQLFIYPESASLDNRDFDFRISSAVVDLEESTFSPFDGFKRKLMILDGEIEISHNGEKEYTLSKFQQCDFEGSWETKSKGKCVDFNLIYRPGFENASLEHFSLLKGESIELNHDGFLAVYCFSGEVVNLKNEKVETFEKGEMFISEKGENNTINFKAIEESEVVVVRV